MKIVNIGSSNIDYVYQMEHFIQPGETLGCAQLSIGCGGKGLNQSIALARAGAEVFHAGLIGREGAFLREKMEEAGVNVEFVRYGEGANGHAIIQVDKTGQNCIILYGGTNHQFTHALVDEVLSHFAAGDIVDAHQRYDTGGISRGNGGSQKVDIYRTMLRVNDDIIQAGLPKALHSCWADQLGKGADG